MRECTLTQPKLVSASEMSRLANVPVGRLLKALRAGAVQPDQTVMDGRLHLFGVDRVEEIRDRLNTIEATQPESELVPA